MGNIHNYIKEGWNECIRETKSDDGTLIGLPYPYTVPSKEAFNELYYWDTYFTNAGLIKSEKAELAKNNTDNILYLVDKYGFMPNGNRTYYLNRSQPPFLSEMVVQEQMQMFFSLYFLQLRLFPADLFLQYLQGKIF